MPVVGMRPKKLPPAARKLFDWAVLHDKPYVLFSIGELFGIAGIYTPFYYVASYAQEKNIIDGRFALYLLVIMNATSTFGRILPGILADKIGPLNVSAPFTAVCALLSYCWIAIDNPAGLVVFSALYGIFSGAFVSLCGPCVASLTPDLPSLGTHMGMSFGFAGFGLFLGTPVSGALLNEHGYTAIQAWSGTINLVAAVFILASRLVKTGPKLMSKA